MSATSALSLIASRALDLLFPPRCLGCGAFGAYLCDACLSSMPRAEPPRCPICWMPRLQGDTCARCRQQPPAYQAARCPFVYQGAAREVVHALKYQGLSAVAPTMAGLMAEYIRHDPIEADLIVAVPLFGGRQRRRGYNQSALLARELSPLLGIPAAPRAARRLRATPPQARSGDASQRWANVAGAFAADPAQVKGKGVLLVDDVMTTGATLDACARALREAGAASVWALTFARED